MEVFIKNLEFNAIIGLLPHERKLPQRVIVNASFTCKDLPMQVDYAKASKMIESTIKNQKYDTVEAALLDLERKLKGAFPLIIGLNLSLMKPDILTNAQVGAQIKRSY